MINWNRLGGGLIRRSVVVCKYMKIPVITYLFRRNSSSMSTIIQWSERPRVNHHPLGFRGAYADLLRSMNGANHFVTELLRSWRLLSQECTCGIPKHQCPLYICGKQINFRRNVLKAPRKLLLSSKYSRSECRSQLTCYRV